MSSHIISSEGALSKVAMLRGGGRHAAVIWEQIASHYENVLVWDDSELMNDLHPLLRTLPRFLPHEKNALLVDSNIDCFVAVGSPCLRQTLTASVTQVLMSKMRCIFPSVVHTTAVVASTARIGSGCFVGPLAVINTYAQVGDFCLINSGAVVEHDCVLGDYATLNPGSMLMGGAVLETLATLGANASVRENCSVQPNTVVGMGAVVVRDISGPRDGFWAGVPAKPVYTSRNDLEQLSMIRWCIKKPFSLQRFQQYLHESLERGHLTNDGPLQAVLQAKVKALVRSRRQVLLCCNGTAALHSLVTAHKLKHGQDIRWVTQAFTFPSSIQGPLIDALVCDIDPHLMGPCMKFLNEHIAEFNGVIVTNVFGLQANVLAYEQWCITNKKFLLFDNAATPIGTVDDGRCIHDIGNGAFISFHETKTYGRGEGGAVFADPELAPFVHQAMNFGFDIPKQIRIPNRHASNWRMSDFASAAICDHIDSINTNKWEEQLNDLARFAIEELERSGFRIAFPVRYPTILSCLFVHLGDMFGEIICHQLNLSGIEAKHYYVPLIERSEAPKAWQLFDHSICLPFHLGLSKSQLKKMISILSQIQSQCKKDPVNLSLCK